ncbi:MAG: DUF3347 domain-containing protein [Bacteroidetes bacterium]|nr:DUF3347 domain-containing protein [Bacteroidota bacterium]MBU1372707.1 DUF3347 domain-containing protein [Bacteroidota bacterium]MBU1484903.1 DUF3347 domain-containing protein [Bacteroidota bacterium]MBU1761690.1 DUF3347 domain-containing protein [Bacteroidota bacterium]MBU2046400.1 DUF3347 domain-containing protein [Bacteroidota bacterium]
MKKIILLVAFIAAFGQFGFALSHDTSPLLEKYYAVKNALTSDNAELAVTAATEFSKVVNATAASVLSDESRAALLKDAGNIAQAKDIKKQREYFKAFSDHFSQLAKTTSLSGDPIYIAYCPMVKANWLSSSPTIKNPYYGKAMLTCGKVVETLK